MKKQKKMPGAYRSLAWRLCVLALTLWLAVTGVLTWCVAADMRLQLQTQLQRYMLFHHDRVDPDELEMPGAAELNMIQSLGYPYLSRIKPLLPIVKKQIQPNPIGDDHWLWGRWDLVYGFEPAVIYYDADKTPLIQTGDYLTFSYTTQEKWHMKDVEPLGQGYIALDALPGGTELADKYITDFITGDVGASWFLPVLRMTGYFEGNQFHPTSIDRGNYYGPDGVQPTDPQKLVNLDGRNQLKWTNILTNEAESGIRQQTIFAWNVGGYNTKAKPVTAGGQRFESLAELLHRDTVCADPGTYEKDSLWETVLIQRRTFTDAAGSCTIAVALRCKPLQYACLRLIWVYILTFAAVGVGLLLLLRRIKKHYTVPIEQMAQAAKYGTEPVPLSGVREVQAVEEFVRQANKALGENKAELQQLRTALDYAREAEKKRKQLISNITHELKTPLAIIHAHAEYLQEELEEEKQVRCLQTVLEETQRMDAMVLQMLDLSRLEAGKVRLASDHFSLLELTRAIAEKQAPLFAQRELTLAYPMAQEFSLTADEGRITQVISNLLSNAQKYSLAGSTVSLKIYELRGNAFFYIENAAPHLSEEALEKVWDSFYRVDEARNTPGTGLGLSLVKSIVGLHGGRCFVKNILLPDGSQGLQFGFRLPLR